MTDSIKPKNVIYVCTSSKLWRAIATQLKNDYAFIPKFHVGFEERATNNPTDIFYGIPFYNINQARRGDAPPLIPGYKYGEHNINLFAEIQSGFDSFLEMCERYIIDRDGGSFEQKKNFFLHLVNIWTGVFDFIKPDVVVVASRPHRMFDLVIEILCKKLDLPIIMLETTDMNNCVYAADLRSGLAFPLDCDYLKEPLVEISKGAKRFVEIKQLDYEEAKPTFDSLNGFFSVERQKKQQGRLAQYKKIMPPVAFLYWSLVKSGLRGTLFEPLPTMIKFSTREDFVFKPIAPKKIDVIFQIYRRQKQIKYAVAFYNENAITADLSKKYIYYTASYQPERSTCPDAGRYHDILLSLGMLANSVSDDTIIYFKEHPRTSSMPADYDAQRAAWFYKEVLSRHSNVIFINDKFSPFDLIDNAYCVAMATGSTAIESVVRGKYCIIFGDNWFSNLPGVLRCYSKSDVRNALNTIETTTIKKSDIYKYLAKLEEYSDDISYLFKSNVSFRRDIERQITEKVTTEQLELNRVNGMRASRQIYRASGFIE